MKVEITRSFYYKKTGTTYAKGKVYDMTNELGNWTKRHKLGGHVLTVDIKDGKPEIKNMKAPTKDRMVKENTTNTKRGEK